MNPIFNVLYAKQIIFSVVLKMVMAMASRELIEFGLKLWVAHMNVSEALIQSRGGEAQQTTTARTSNTFFKDCTGRRQEVFLGNVDVRLHCLAYDHNVWKDFIKLNTYKTTRLLSMSVHHGIYNHCRRT